MNFENNPIQFSNIVLAGEHQLAVNARDVHVALEVKSEFSHWIKKRISQCKFEENYDFIKVVKKNDLSKTGQWVTEYIVSLDMAKHLGMLEKNDKGHEIRKYFIEQEKIARNATQSIQLEIGKMMQQIGQFTDSLSNAGRFLSIGGKQIKPKLINELDTLIGQAQHSLNFGNGE